MWILAEIMSSFCRHSTLRYCPPRGGGSPRSLIPGQHKMTNELSNITPDPLAAHKHSITYMPEP